MGAFEYSALNSSGRLIKGVLEGDTAKLARQILRAQGLTPVSLEEVTEKSSGRSGRVAFYRKINATDLALLTRQLATLIRSGTMLEEALGAIIEQTEKTRIKRVMAAVRSKVLEGHSLAKALAEFPSTFPELYRATVAAGEEAGHLDVVFERLADYTEFRQQVRQKIMLALMYPLFLTIVAILIVTALLTYVVPQIITVFQNVGQKLPLLTRGLIITSTFLKEYGWLLLLLSLCFILVLRFLLRQKKIKFSVHLFFLKLPIISTFIRTLNAASFARSFSIVTASGVSVVDGLRLSAKVVGNLPMRLAVESAAAKVREGESLHRTLGKSGYFPPITIHLIASGETSSRLEEMLDKAAQIQEREIETLVAASLGIFEPMLILLMGLLVLGIVLAILLPILDVNQLVR